MELILLPGMDGSGLLFKPFLDVLPKDIETRIISYPCDKKLSYQELIAYVQKKLPKKTDFVLLAESFSGPIAYEIAKDENENLKAIIFVAGFILPPNKLLSLARIIPFASLIPSQIPGIFLRFLLGKRANQMLHQLFKEALEKVNNQVLGNRIEEMANLSLYLQVINKKCIYIQADSDYLVSSKHAMAISQVTEQFHLYKVEGSHFVLQVNPEKCSEIVQKEIREQFTTIDIAGNS